MVKNDAKLPFRPAFVVPRRLRASALTLVISQTSRRGRGTRRRHEEDRAAGAPIVALLTSGLLVGVSHGGAAGIADRK